MVNLYIHERREGDVAVLDLRGRIRISGGTLSFLDQATNRSVQGKSAAANSDAAPHVKNSYISLAAFMNIKIDQSRLLRDFERCSQACSHGLD